MDLNNLRLHFILKRPLVRGGKQNKAQANRRVPCGDGLAGCPCNGASARPSRDASARPATTPAAPRFRALLTVCRPAPAFCQAALPRGQPRRQPRLGSDVPAGCHVPCKGKSWRSSAAGRGQGLPGGRAVTPHFVRYSCLSPPRPERCRTGGRCTFPWACRRCAVRKSKAVLLRNNVERREEAGKAPGGTLPSGVGIYSFALCHQSSFLCSWV